MSKFNTRLSRPDRGRWKMFIVGAVVLAAGGMSASFAHESEGERYPTPVIADYVLGCMAANGNSFEALHQCSCSIDHIMSKLSYEDYEKASTVMQVQLDRGQRGIFYRDSNWAKSMISAFEDIQAESTLRCF